MRPALGSRLLCSLVGVAFACAAPKAVPAGLAGSADSERDLVEGLTRSFGCDETFVARNPESTAVLAVQVPGILERSGGAELPYTEELAVGAPALIVRLERGADLDHWCTDVMARPPRIDTAWIGVAGGATVVLLRRRDPTAAPGDRPAPTVAAVRLGPIVVAREDRPEERLTLPGLEIEATLGVPAGG